MDSTLYNPQYPNHSAHSAHFVIFGDVRKNEAVVGELVGEFVGLALGELDGGVKVLLDTPYTHKITSSMKCWKRLASAPLFNTLFLQKLDYSLESWTGTSKGEGERLGLLFFFFFLFTINCEYPLEGRTKETSHFHCFFDDRGIGRSSRRRIGWGTSGAIIIAWGIRRGVEEGAIGTFFHKNKKTKISNLF